MSSERPVCSRYIPAIMKPGVCLRCTRAQTDHGAAPPQAASGEGVAAGSSSISVNDAVPAASGPHLYVHALQSIFEFLASLRDLRACFCVSKDWQAGVIATPSKQLILDRKMDSSGTLVRGLVESPLRKHIAHVALNGSAVNRIELERIAQHLPHLTHLELAMKSDVVTPVWPRSLRTLRLHYYSFNPSGAESRLTDTQAVSICTHPNLQYVHFPRDTFKLGVKELDQLLRAGPGPEERWKEISPISVHRSTANALTSFHALESLDWSYSYPSTDSIDFLSRMKSLRELHLNQVGGVSAPEHVRTLCQLRSLTHLGLVGWDRDVPDTENLGINMGKERWNYTAEQMTQIISALPHLTSFRFIRGVNTHSLDFLTNNPVGLRLKALSLVGSIDRKSSPDDWDTIRQLQCLTQLDTQDSFWWGGVTQQIQEEMTPPSKTLPNLKSFIVRRW